MRTFAIALLSSLPLTAAAAPFADKVGDVESIEIDGTVTVPLYADSNNVARASVLATLPGGEDGEDQEFFFGLATSSNVIVVSDAFVTAAGLKAKDRNKKTINLKGKDHSHRLGGELKTVTIPTLQIGDLVLKDVNALVSSSKHRLGGVHHDLQLGLGAIPELAWAILPSSGEVKFAAAGADGAALVASVGSASETRSTGWDNPKFGEGRVLASAASLLSEVTVGGSTAYASLEVASTQSSISSELSLKSSAHKNQADRHRYWVETSLTSGWVLSTSSFERGTHPRHKAVLGAHLLGAFDLAHDPQSKTLALSEASEVSWNSQDTHHIDQALSALEAPAASDDSDDSEAEGASGPNVGALVSLAHAYEGSYQLTEAIDTWSQVVDAEPDNCAHALSLGKALLAAGDVKGAMTPLSNSSRLYHTWWDLDLELRTEISDYRAAEAGDGFKNAVKLAFLDSPADDAPDSQSGACHVADGLLAAAHLAQGNDDTVSNLYDKRLDLDPALAQAQGTAALARGDTQAAHSALRQALKRESSPQVNSRIGLAQAYLQDGDWGTAEQHYLKALSIDPSDSVLVALWIDAKFEEDGARATLEAATQWAASRPNNIAAQYAQVRAAWLAGDDAAVAAGATEAEARMSRISRIHLFPSTSLSNLARVRALSDNPAGALEAAERAVEMNPSIGVSWLALAEAQAANGSPDPEAIAQAARVQPLTPGLGDQVADLDY